MKFTIEFNDEFISKELKKDIYEHYGRLIKNGVVKIDTLEREIPTRDMVKTMIFDTVMRNIYYEVRKQATIQLDRIICDIEHDRSV